MARSKASMLEEIRLKGGAIMSLLMEEDVKIKPEHLLIPKDAIDFKMDFIRPAHAWVVDVFRMEYIEVRRIKKMQPEEMWTRYKSWGGFEEHREVTLLNTALSDLRCRLVSRKRPDFFKKSKRNAKRNKTKAGISKAQTSGRTAKQS